MSSTERQHSSSTRSNTVSEQHAPMQGSAAQRTSARGGTAQHTPVQRGSAQHKITAAPAFLYATVLVMGAVGATLRYGIELALPSSGFPVNTLLINIVGCYIIYVVYQWFDRRVHIPHSIARGIGVGLVGAFTTLSAFCTESLGLLQTGEYLLFAAYVAATVFCTFLASIAGWATCSLLAYRRLKRLQARRIQHRLEMQRAKRTGSAATDGRRPS